MKITLPSLSKQAFIALLSYIIVIVALFLPLHPSNNKDLENTTNKYNLNNRIVAALILLIPIGLSVYTINCLVVGKCLTWSWINAIVVAIWSILILSSSIYAMYYKVPDVDANANKTSNF